MFEIGKEYADYDEFGGGSDVLFWAQRLNDDLRLTPISPRLIALDEEGLGKAVKEFFQLQPGDKYLSFREFEPRIDDTIRASLEHGELVAFRNAVALNK